MKKPEIELGVRAYESDHIKEVLQEIKNNFGIYFNWFCSNYHYSSGQRIHNDNKYLYAIFIKSIEVFEKEQKFYEEFLDLDTLEEYEEDPAAFKRAMQNECPIIRRCLQSEEEDMKKFQRAFRNKGGRELLDVTKRIMIFGKKYNSSFNDVKHENITDVDGLCISELLEDDYIAHEVIGGGIKSIFLFMIYPNAFANRSQNAIWSFYFLTDKKDFGFEDCSEFLMIDEQKSKIYQNYHYPYDLFSFYSLKLYLLLKEMSEKKGYRFLNKYRYIYLDTFFNSIADKHRIDIDTLKGKQHEKKY